jgi:hypothetical protein
LKKNYACLLVEKSHWTYQSLLMIVNHLINSWFFNQYVTCYSFLPSNKEKPNLEI